MIVEMPVFQNLELQKTPDNILFCISSNIGHSVIERWQTNKLTQLMEGKDGVEAAGLVPASKLVFLGVYAPPLQQVRGSR
jgi:hypothetical protein